MDRREIYLHNAGTVEIESKTQGVSIRFLGNAVSATK
jgi:hypothetical protein